MPAQGAEIMRPRSIPQERMPRRISAMSEVTGYLTRIIEVGSLAVRPPKVPSA